MKTRISTLLLCALLLVYPLAAAEGSRIAPAYPVPDYVTWLLETADNEVGYVEGRNNYSKYGEWAGDPNAQWCAEFVCWCVDQVDQKHGTHLLKNVYPRYSGQNGGSKWFTAHGRYVVRNGHLEDWGYQWLNGEDQFITTGSYIPQPGDLVFFTWTSDTNTDHVSIVEYCTQEKDGRVLIHVIEGNNPDRVQRNTYDVTYNRIVGYGTVHDVAGWTMRSGNTGEKVRQLQEKLVKVGFMREEQVDGYYGAATVASVKAYQRFCGLEESGIANIQMQKALDLEAKEVSFTDPDSWTVEDDD